MGRTKREKKRTKNERKKLASGRLYIVIICSCVEGITGESKRRNVPQCWSKGDVQDS